MIKKILLILIVFSFNINVAYSQSKNQSRYKEYISTEKWKKEHDEAMENSFFDWNAMKLEFYSYRLAISDWIDPVKTKNGSEKTKEFSGFGGGSFGGGGASGTFDVEKKATKLVESNKQQIILTTECQWDPTSPPRIIEAPGCSVSGQRLCRGMVKCGNKVRLATCSEIFCKENTATECSKQLGYSSKSVE